MSDEDVEEAVTEKPEDLNINQTETVGSSGNLG
jgi:hypothetical protein